MAYICSGTVSGRNGGGDPLDLLTAVTITEVSPICRTTIVTRLSKLEQCLVTMYVYHHG